MKKLILTLSIVFAVISAQSQVSFSIGLGANTNNGYYNNDPYYYYYNGNNNIMPGGCTQVPQSNCNQRQRKCNCQNRQNNGCGHNNYSYGNNSQAVRYITVETRDPNYERTYRGYDDAVYDERLATYYADHEASQRNRGGERVFVERRRY
jgi:hypothetical protein